MRKLCLLMLAGVVAAGCVGPKPEVLSAEVMPPDNGTAAVTITIANKGGGDGQVEVEVTLRQGSDVIGREEKTTELKAHETITLILNVDVPDDARDLAVEAEVHYPPD